ncbi:unnamed protein product [Angiostrongylus costaricensis]|uniref:Secreted protein n=1 Tax=Angiostrongylus costaricensis TaxID=334426 RepID=A0A0R3PLR4_ANGCS|nr:unnamed protein product [Angiostrongylus costaricensis]
MLRLIDYKVLIYKSAFVFSLLPEVIRLWWSEGLRRWPWPFSAVAGKAVVLSALRQGRPERCVTPSIAPTDLPGDAGDAVCGGKRRLVGRSEPAVVIFWRTANTWGHHTAVSRLGQPQAEVHKRY